MDPIIGGALIAGGSSLLGGFLGQEAADRRADEAYERQLALEGTQIQRRVKDAKEAGIHPLFAMGGQIMSGPPMAMGDTVGGAIAEGGQSVGNIVSRMATQPERQKMQAELGLVASQMAESDARRMLYEAEAAKIRQSMGTGGNGGLGIQSEGGPTGTMSEHGQMGGNPAGTGIIDKQASPQISSKLGHPGVVAGLHPYSKEYEVVAGFPIMLPQSNEGPAETIESMSVAEYATFIAQNSRIYGEGWFDDFIRWRKGERPSRSYKMQKDQARDKRPPTLEESIRNKVEGGWSGKGYPKYESPELGDILRKKRG